MPIVHYIGAFLVFGFGVLYGWGQTLMSIKLFHAGHTHLIRERRNIGPSDQTGAMCVVDNRKQ